MMSSDQIDKSEDEQKFEESSKAPKKRIRKTKITNLNNKKTGRWILFFLKRLFSR